MTDLVSTAPFIFSAFLSLVTAAGQSQNPPVYVAPFELMQYEPASYVILTGIENHRWEWESLGTYGQKEYYDIAGFASVYTGDTPDALNPTVATTVMTNTYALFQSCVMTPFIENRNAPVAGNTAPSPNSIFLDLPSYARYKGMSGDMGNADSGFQGVLEFAFSYAAYLTPQ